MAIDNGCFRGKRIIHLPVLYLTLSLLFRNISAGIAGGLFIVYSLVMTILLISYNGDDNLQNLLANSFIYYIVKYVINFILLAFLCISCVVHLFYVQLRDGIHNQEIRAGVPLIQSYLYRILGLLIHGYIFILVSYVLALIIAPTAGSSLPDGVVWNLAVVSNSFYFLLYLLLVMFSVFFILFTKRSVSIVLTIILALILSLSSTGYGLTNNIKSSIAEINSNGKQTLYEKLDAIQKGRMSMHDGYRLYCALSKSNPEALKIMASWLDMSSATVAVYQKNVVQPKPFNQIVNDFMIGDYASWMDLSQTRGVNSFLDFIIRTQKLIDKKTDSFSQYTVRYSPIYDYFYQNDVNNRVDCSFRSDGAASISNIFAQLANATASNDDKDFYKLLASLSRNYETHNAIISTLYTYGEPVPYAGYLTMSFNGEGVENNRSLIGKTEPTNAIIVKQEASWYINGIFNAMNNIDPNLFNNLGLLASDGTYKLDQMNLIFNPFAHLLFLFNGHSAKDSIFNTLANNFLNSIYKGPVNDYFAFNVIDKATLKNHVGWTFGNSDKLLFVKAIKAKGDKKYVNYEGLYIAYYIIFGLITCAFYWKYRRIIVV